MSSIKSKLITYLLVLVVSALSIEIGSWLILSVFSKNNVVTDTFIFKSENKDGSFIPNYDSVVPIQENANFRWIREEFDVLVKTNSTGLRENFEVDYESVKIAFFGDSFTFGHGVNVEDRYTNIFAQRSDLFSADQVVSMSYKNGFQPEHYEFWLRNVTTLKPDYIVMGLYLGTDLGADVLETVYDVKNNKLSLPYRLYQETGQIRINPSTFKQPWRAMRSYSNFGTLAVKLIGRSSYRSKLFENEVPNSPNSIPLELGKTDLYKNHAMKSITRIRKLADARGSKLIVLLIPQNFYFGNENPHIHKDLAKKLIDVRTKRNLLKQVKEFCKENSLRCLDLLSVLSRDDYFLLDAHWNINGHLKVGSYLADTIKILYDELSDNQSKLKK